MLKVKTKIENHQLIKVAKFRKNVRTTAPHKHNSYLEIVLLNKGGGSHTIDGKQHVVRPPVLFVIRKEQVHHWELEGAPEGYVLILKKQYLDDSLDKSLKEIVSKISAHTCVYLKNADTITALFELLLGEWEQALPYRNGVIEGLLKALSARVLQQTQQGEQRRTGFADIFSRFEYLLVQTETLRNSVAHYAALLNTTPQNLNTICRKAAGQTATEVLAGHLLAEAKRLLLYTDMTVGEIATQFDFRDNSHFIKYFKRHTGTTPNMFRQAG